MTTTGLRLDYGIWMDPNTVENVLIHSYISFHSTTGNSILIKNHKKTLNSTVKQTQHLNMVNLPTLWNLLKLNFIELCDEQKLLTHGRMGMTDAKAEWVLKKNDKFISLPPSFEFKLLALRNNNTVEANIFYWFTFKCTFFWWRLNPDLYANVFVHRLHV